MESLSRRDLQKFCLEQRKSGLLPPETKCNGSRPDLLALLDHSNVSEKVLEEPHTKYSNLIRHLAPYLTLDKLLLILAYYPQHFLLGEVKDPQGKIWSDRTWVELGEAPLPIGKHGIRYYHLWSTRRLSPWGELVIPTTRNISALINFNTQIRVKEADFNLGYSMDNTRSGDSQPMTLTVWALRPQGFSHLRVKVNIKDPSDTSPEIMEALSEPSNWRLVSPGNFTMMVVMGVYRIYALDSLGNLRHFGYGENDEILELPQPLEDIKLRYVRPWRSYLYGITNLGEHIIYDTFHSQIIPFVKSPSRLRSRTEDTEIFVLENLYYRPSDPRVDYIYAPPNVAFPTNYTSAHVRGHIPQMVEDLIYLIPEANIVAGVYEKTGVTPFRSLGTIRVLGVDGKIYDDETLYSKGNNYKLKAKNLPYRYFYYEDGGVAW